MTPSRANGFLNLVETLKKKTRTLIKSFPEFPSLLITASALTPQGSFAEAQSKYLHPDREGYQISDFREHMVFLDAKQLGEMLQEKQVGVVAHFYMDPEVRCEFPCLSQWPTLSALGTRHVGCRF